MSLLFSCFEQSLLELWDFSEEIISNLTQEEIVRDINAKKYRYYYNKTT